MSARPDRSSPPRLGPPWPPVVPRIVRDTLPGGLTVLLVERHGLPVVSARLVVRGGAAADPPGLEGRASLTASALDEGTATHDAAGLAAALARLGAAFHAMADWHETLLSLHVLTPHLREALGLMAAIARRPAFPPEAVARRRAERVAALLQDREEPAATASRALARAIYDGHRYGAGPAGSPDTVAELTRDDLVAAHARDFDPARSFLVLAGDVAMDSVRPLLEETFGDWSAASAADPREPSAAQAAPPVIHVVDRPGAPQSELRVGHDGPPRATPDYFPLIIANTILGGAFTSRINSVLREQKGLTYGARTGFAFRRAGGPFAASVAVQTDATGEAVRDILDAIEGLRQAAPTDAELERARAWLALGMPRTLETTGALVERVTDIEAHGLGDDYLDRFMDRVAAVGAGDVRDAARRHLRPAAAAIAVVGDLARIRAALESLGRGAVRPVDAP